VIAPYQSFGAIVTRFVQEALPTSASTVFSPFPTNVPDAPVLTKIRTPSFTFVH
jgi:hypothetical protein